MNGTTRKCPICEEPYKVYDYTVADQSACPDCVRKAENKENRSFFQDFRQTCSFKQSVWRGSHCEAYLCRDTNKK